MATEDHPPPSQPELQYQPPAQQKPSQQQVQIQPPPSPWVVFVVVATVILGVVVYIMVTGLMPRTSERPSIPIHVVTVTSNTTAEMTFSKLVNDPSVRNLKVVLKIGLISGIYSFKSDADGTIATLDSGLNLGTITYKDWVDNKKVNTGDRLFLTNLYENSRYVIRLVWAPSGDMIHTGSFATPP